MAEENNDFALVLTGGGARAAYQVGFLRGLSRQFPDLHFSILTGVSAGAINAAYIANHSGSFAEAIDDLAGLWSELVVEKVFRADPWSLVKSVFGWGAALLSGGAVKAPAARGLVDTTPLHRLLDTRMAATEGVLRGVGENLRRGRLKALAITGTKYGTSQALTWVQGKGIETWERPHRRSVQTEICTAHVMASAALPLFFPAIRVGDAWYGDGGIHQRALEVINFLLEKVPREDVKPLRPVELFLLRPSRNLSQEAHRFEARLPGMFRFLTRGLGTKQTESPDWLSMVLFDPDYLNLLMRIGEEDAEARREDFAARLG
ncbi:MAG: patatin-like phospholipase family protein [Desulfuromonadales bacterium]